MRYTILTFGRLQRVAWFTLAFVVLVANAIAAADRAESDAFVLMVAHVAGNADAGVRRSANTVRAIVLADRFAAGQSVRIAFIAVAADLYFAHVRSGTIADGNH